MAALGRMAANFAHQIRNPLTAVGGLARRLASLDLDAKGQKYTASIGAEAARLELVLNNMLSYVQPPPLNLQLHSIVEVGGGVPGRFFRSPQGAGRGGAEGLSACASIAFRPETALSCSGKSAEQRFGSHAGWRSIIAGNQTGRRGKGTEGLIEVRDSGPGMATDTLEIIFEPFYTTKVGEKKVGLGLGNRQEDH